MASLVTQPLEQHKENSMSKRNTVSVTILSAFALTLCLVSAVTTAQKEPKAVAVPLEGVNITLVRIGDLKGQVVAINQRNKDGKWAFPSQPAGSYSLTISLPKSSAREANPSTADIKTCSITILGAAGGTKTEDWNLETNRIIIKSSNNQKTTPGEDKI